MKLKFSTWCDRIKKDHAFCVDEKQTKLDFITNLLIGYFINSRGCSKLNATGYATDHITNVYEEISERVNVKI